MNRSSSTTPIFIDVEQKVTKDRLSEMSGIEQMIDGQFMKPPTKYPPKRTDIKHLSDKEMRLILWKNQGRKYGNPYCSTDELRKEDVHLDYRIPKKRGGPDDITHRIGLCGNCNARRA